MRIFGYTLMILALCICLSSNINADATLSEGNGFAVTLYNGYKGRFYPYVNELAVQNNGSGPISFYTSELAGAGIQRMTISNSGHVGINHGAPFSSLVVSDHNDEICLITVKQTGNRNWAGLRIDRNSSEKWFIGMDDDDDNLLIRRDAGTNDIIIDTTGRVGIGRIPSSGGTHKLEVEGTAAKTSGGSTWATLSDGRLKNIHKDYDKGLDEIAQLHPKEFTYKKENPRRMPHNEQSVGLIAQEVALVFPNAVNRGTDGFLELNMHEINIAMICAIKELKAENDMLRQELTRLKKHIKNSM